MTNGGGSHDPKTTSNKEPEQQEDHGEEKPRK